MERKKTYSEADFRINCGNLKTEEITLKILSLYEKTEIRFKRLNNNYSIIIGENILKILSNKGNYVQKPKTSHLSLIKIYQLNLKPFLKII